MSTTPAPFVVTPAFTPSHPDRATIRSVNPATGQLLGEVPVRTAEEVRDAVARARIAQEAWGLLSVEERCRRLAWFREALVTRTEEVADLLSHETGKPRIEALHEVVVLLDLVAFYG